MGLWQRIKRVFRASTGAALDRIENPELVLQQTIRDMRDRVPELNNSVAQVMATERLLARNKDNLDKQVVDLDSKIRAVRIQMIARGAPHHRVEEIMHGQLVFEFSR